MQPAVVDIHDAAKHLWEAADELRANSHLNPAQFGLPVLGPLFMRFADSRFTEAETDLAGEATGRWDIGKIDHQAKAVIRRQ